MTDVLKGAVWQECGERTWRLGRPGCLLALVTWDREARKYLGAVLCHDHDVTVPGTTSLQEAMRRTEKALRLHGGPCLSSPLSSVTNWDDL